ncbi:sensor domain-containing protein [Thermobifida halotolerans]|uniref:histidine kinase n=2 Tax=Thermobifida halotolerans TaxID=483545 RepID=A0A399G193_9ACTN|nr:sensor domain-containing protein [Thermobifida halotolerans]
MASGGLGVWRERLVAVLHLFTSLVLSLLYLIPATLLFLMVGSLSATVAEILLGMVSPDWELPVLAFLTAWALPVSTLLARFCTRVQRRRMSDLFGIVETTVPESSEDHPAVRVLRFLLGRDAWTAVLYSTAAGLVGLMSGGLAVLLVAYGVGGTFGGMLALALVTLGGVPAEQDSLITVVMYTLAGPLLAVSGLWVAPWLVRVDADIMQRMLFDSPQVRVRRRLLELHDTRSRMVDAAEAERRRIERDLHDGAQQRLLALTMTLTRARAKFERDPEQARALLEEAQSESRAVMADLREVARGLHPRVLTDHGLDAALPVAAGRCPVPVRVEVDLADRPSPRAEGVAYYVACEALTNIAKHAGATTVTVRVERVPQRRGDLLRITVADDGRGGANPDKGTGLYGLWDRVHAVDGELSVHSPPGGGTTLTANIPWKA